MTTKSDFVFAQPRPEADIVERQSRRAVRQECATNYPMALRGLERPPISIAVDLGTNELGAKVSAIPPDNLVIATLAGAPFGEDQHKVIGNVETVDVNPQAAFGNVSNEAVALCIPEFDHRQTPEAAAWRLALLFRLRRKQWMQDPKLWPLRNEWRQTLLANSVPNGYCERANAYARVFLEFA